MTSPWLSVPLEDYEGHMSAKGVQQLPSESEQAVAGTGYASMQNLKQDFALIDVNEFQRLLAPRHFHLIEQKRCPVPAGKALWLGIFAKTQ